jgi:class 3 adenylate cyclase
MKCPNCSTVNDQESKFCKNCGSPLTFACPECGAASSVGESNCPECGAPSLQNQINHQASIPSWTDKQGFQPQSTTSFSFKAPFSDNDTLTGERRVVTILFSDIKGSTSMAEGLDPEEWAEIANQAFQELIEPVYRYGGIVARLMGDAILAFFGAPKAHEDDPQRAVLAGLDIISGIDAFNRKYEQNTGMKFDIRVGINTGLVVVGNIGSDLRAEYTAMGDAVNLAARMEQTAPPGSVQISEETFRLISPMFETEDLGYLEIKGKSKPVRAYRVIGKKVKPRDQRGIFGLNAPLVGREVEIQQLRQITSLVHQGRGQIICLIGEAGIGKSRLISELHQEWLTYENNGKFKQRDHNNGHIPSSWRESRSISYATNLPYGTFQQLVHNLCGTTPGDSQESIRDKIACNCLTSDAPEDQCIRVSRAFEMLLGVQTNQETSQLEGETFKRELFDAMMTTWRDWASHTPTALVFDDLHWADAASVELLIHLFDLANDVPVLFLCAFRPERDSSTWEIKQAAEREFPHLYTEFHLQPLDSEHSNLLIHHLISSVSLPGQLIDLILKKSEGNPFFLEQIVQSLIETGTLLPEKTSDAVQDTPKWRLDRELSKINIPDTVQALLQARIDRLDDDVRQTLQKAAVIGRSFSYRILREISDGTNNLNRNLRTLERVDLIREQTRFPEIEYAFRHALAQETIYKSILRKKRRLYHRQVGEAIERLFPERLDEAAPLLAHHYYEAGDRRALYYYTQAGDLAARMYANSEAVSHYTRALEVAHNIQEYQELEHLYIQKGRALELNAQYELALANYSEMENFANQVDNQHLSLAALMARATLLSMPITLSDPEQSRKYLNKALALARDLGDRPFEAKILWNLSLNIIRYGNPIHAVEYGEQALSIARELDLKELIAYTLTDLSEVYLYTGELELGRQSLMESRQLWNLLGNKPMFVNCLANSAYIEFLYANYEKAISLSQEALHISRSINNLWGQAYSLVYVTMVYFERGQIDKAISVMEDCLRLAEQAGFLVPLAYTRAELALVYASLGFYDIANELIDTAYQFFHATPLAMRPEFYRLVLKIQLSNGSIEKAHEVYKELLQSNLVTSFVNGYVALANCEFNLHIGNYQKVLETADDLIDISNKGMRYFEQYGCYFKGIALMRSGKIDEAQEYLFKGRDIAEKLDALQVLWPILAALIEIEIQRNNRNQAIDHYKQLVSAINFIADSIANSRPSIGSAAQLRTSFLNRPQVRSALELEGRL